MSKRTTVVRVSRLCALVGMMGALFAPMAGASTIAAFAYYDTGAGGALVSDTGTASASVSVTGDTSGSGTFSAVSTASAEYGVLKVFTSVDLSGYSPNSYTTTGGSCAFTFCGPDGTGPVLIPVFSDASFTDDMTLTGGTGSVWVRLLFSVDGTTSVVSDDPEVDFQTSAQSGLTAFIGGTRVLGQDYFGGTYTFLSDPIEFTYGVAQQLFVFNYSEVDLIDATAAGIYDFSGSADFYNTLQLTQVNAYSNPGGTIPVTTPFSLTMDSGAQFGTNSPRSDVPEPSTWLLTVSALAIAAWRRSTRSAP